MSSRRREQRAWYVYDWANSAFSTTVVTALFGPYLTELVRVAASPQGRVQLLGVVAVDYRAVWEWLMALSVATQALAMPLVGAIADHGRLKKRLWAVMAYLGAGATVAMYWLEDGRWMLGCVLFLLANLAFGNSMLLYNAFLPEISGPTERDAVSSKGWAVGYAGGGLLLSLNLLLFTQAERFGLSQAEAARISLGSAGVWWALFALIPLALLRSKPGKKLPAGQGYLITGIRQLRRTLTKARRLPDTLWFLAAYLVYNDGIQTVLVLAGQFAVVELKLSYSSVLGSFLLSQVVGIPGAISFQRIAGYIGNKRAVMLALAVWTLTMLYVFAGVTTKEEFFLLSAVAGFVMGGSQALSRSIFSFLIPKGEEAEYFSLYEVSDKGSSLLGPAVLASVVDATGSFRLGALALAAFFVAGFGILSRVDVGRGALAVGNEAPPAVQMRKRR